MRADAGDKGGTSIGRRIEERPPHRTERHGARHRSAVQYRRLRRRYGVQDAYRRSVAIFDDLIANLAAGCDNQTAPDEHENGADDAN